MVAYNFQPEFVAAIATGAKRSTMRGPRRRHVAAGETFRLYTGQRSKACRLLGAATCQRIDPVRLNLKHGLADIASRRHRGHWDTLDPDRLARQEGFPDWAALAAFWLAHHGEAWSWEGWLISWGMTFVAADR